MAFIGNAIYIVNNNNVSSSVLNNFNNFYNLSKDYLIFLIDDGLLIHRSSGNSLDDKYTVSYINLNFKKYNKYWEDIKDIIIPYFELINEEFDLLETVNGVDISIEYNIEYHINNTHLTLEELERFDCDTEILSIRFGIVYKNFD